MLKARPAFSLLEVTVVVCLLGLLAAVATPTFSRSLQTSAARNAAYQIGCYIQHARNTAMVEGRMTSIEVNAEEDLFLCPNVEFPGRIGVPIRLAIKSEFDSGLELSGMFGDRSTMQFDLEGMAYVDGKPIQKGYVRISTPDTQFLVSIDCITGKVTTIQTQDPLSLVDRDSEGT